MDKAPPASSGNIPQQPSTLLKTAKSIVGITAVLAGVATVVTGIGLGIILVHATPMKHLRILAVITPIMLGGGVVTSIGMKILLPKNKPNKASELPPQTAEQRSASHAGSESKATTWRARKGEIISKAADVIYGNPAKGIPPGVPKGGYEDPAKQKEQFLDLGSTIIRGIQSDLQDSRTQELLQQDLNNNSNISVDDVRSINTGSGAVSVPNQFCKDAGRSLPQQVILHSNNGQAEVLAKYQQGEEEGDDEAAEAGGLQGHNQINAFVNPKAGEEEWVSRIEVELSQGSQAVGAIVTQSLNPLGSGLAGAYLDLQSVLGARSEGRQDVNVQKDTNGDIQSVSFRTIHEIGYTQGPKGTETGPPFIGSGVMVTESYKLEKNTAGEFVINDYKCHVQPQNETWTPGPSARLTERVIQRVGVLQGEQMSRPPIEDIGSEASKASFRQEMHSFYEDNLKEYSIDPSISSAIGADASRITHNAVGSLSVVANHSNGRKPADATTPPQDKVPSIFLSDAAERGGSSKFIQIKSGTAETPFVKAENVKDNLIFDEKGEKKPLVQVNKEVRELLGAPDDGTRDDWVHFVEVQFSQTSEGLPGEMTSLSMLGLSMGIDETGNCLSIDKDKGQMQAIVVKNSQGEITEVRFKLETNLPYTKKQAGQPARGEPIGGGLRTEESYVVRRGEDGKLAIQDYRCNIQEMPDDWKPAGSGQKAAE